MLLDMLFRCHAGFFFFFGSYTLCILGKSYSQVDAILSFSLFARWRYDSLFIYSQLSNAPAFWVTTEIRDPEHQKMDSCGIYLMLFLVVIFAGYL